MSEREMISRSHPENEALRRETVKWQQRENDALREENKKLRRAMHDIYEVYAGIDGYLFDESKAYREQQFKSIADIAAEHKDGRD